MSDKKPKPKVIKEPFYKKTIFWIVTVLSILGAPTIYQNIAGLFKSSDQKLYDETFIPGFIITDEVNQDNNPYVIVRAGGIDQRALISGLSSKEFNALSIITCSDNNGNIVDTHPLNLLFKLIDNRIYLSFVLADIGTREVVGTMEDNHWEFKKSNIYSIKSSQRGFEITDKQGYVIMSLIVKSGNVFDIEGYFLKRNDTKVCIMAANFYAPCQPIKTKGQMDTALNLIRQIDRRF